MIPMKWKQYTALAGAMLAFKKESDAQISYTDIPDMVVHWGQEYAIDLNNDGIFDFKMVGDSQSSSNNTTFYSMQKLSITGFGSNEILGVQTKPSALMYLDIVSGQGAWMGGAGLLNSHVFTGVCYYSCLLFMGLER
jgi:hypothetical protein